MCSNVRNVDLQQSPQDRKVGRYLLDSWVVGKLLIDAETVVIIGNRKEGKYENSIT